ncbi:MAG: hypothetical protein IJU52_03400 [Clostridia bacterium]|nr:hypothetical protein [Clostridia bacterium]
MEKRSLKTPKRVTLFCGHYGSGKTNLAVNYALYLRARGLEVGIGDLDVVNPYFRTADSKKELEEAGVRVIALPYANSSVDLPSLPPEAYALVEDRRRYAVIDVGGDDRGAYALGRYTPYILEENDYENLCVVNFMRPLTRTAKEAYAVLREIEAAGGVPFTAIVHNTNLGAETTPQTVMSAEKEALKLSELSGLPVLFTSADEKIANQIPGAFPLRLQRRPFE